MSRRGFIEETYQTDEKGWLEWIEEEQKARIEEWGYDSIGEITDYWLGNPQEEPIIAARTGNGRIEIWDGYHRFGIAIRKNLKIVPVILGEIINRTT